MNVQNPQNNIDARWVAYRAACYLGGRGLVYGCGPYSPIPQQAKEPGKYGLTIDPRNVPNVGMCDEEFGLLADRAADFVFVGFDAALAVVERLKPKLKVGGHMVVHSSEGQSLEEMMALLGTWKEKINIVRDGQQLWIGKLLKHHAGRIVKQQPSGKPRACIVRYGAIGDMVMVTPLIKQLALDGYEVTVNSAPYNMSVLENNPYVSNLLPQQRDIVPNPELGNYWAEWAGDYERYINLSESIEGSLLKIETRQDYYTSKADKQELGQVNYIDRTMQLGGYDLKGCMPELFISKAEQTAAKQLIARAGAERAFKIAWALRGSSYHKVYPLLEPLMRRWLASRPDAVLFTLGGPESRGLELRPHQQIVNLVNVADLRTIFALLPECQLVAGPESALTNAASCWPNLPKLVLLSHSTQENLTKYWENCWTLAPETACHPCHQLHYTKETCPLVQVQSTVMPAPAVLPACSVGVHPERVEEVLTLVYERWKAQQ